MLLVYVYHFIGNDTNFNSQMNVFSCPYLLILLSMQQLNLFFSLH